MNNEITLTGNPAATRQDWGIPSLPSIEEAEALLNDRSLMSENGDSPSDAPVNPLRAALARQAAAKVPAADEPRDPAEGTEATIPTPQEAAPAVPVATPAPQEDEPVSIESPTHPVTDGGEQAAAVLAERFGTDVEAQRDLMTGLHPAKQNKLAALLGNADLGGTMAASHTVTSIIPTVTSAVEIIDPMVFIPENVPNIVGMETERRAVEMTMDRPNEPLTPLILIGHTGVAKTTLIKRVHQEKKIPYRSVTCNGSVEVETLVGKWIATPKEGMVFKLGILPFCMKHGIPLGVQEINFAPPEVLVLLHELVDEGHITLMELDPAHPDYVIYPHADFRLYGTMNPPELYAGARDLSPALARRAIVRRVDMLTEEQECRVVIEQAPGVSADIAKSLVTVGKTIRESFDQHKTLYFLSTADLVMWGRLIVYGLEPVEASELAMVGKAAESDVEFIRNSVRLQFDPNAVTESGRDSFH